MAPHPLCACAVLAQNRYIEDPAFVDYLDYLQYWREPRYSKYIKFPQCLRALELLQEPSFRTELKRAEFKDYLNSQQHWHWRLRNEPIPEPPTTTDVTSANATQT